MMQNTFVDREVLSHAENVAEELETPRRIAIFRALQLGDLLLAVPAFRAIRKQFPQAEITLIGLPWAKDFAQRYAAYIDRFVEFVGYPGIQEVEVEDRRTAQFLAEQRAYSYDLVVQMHGSGLSSNPFALALGGKVTAGYYRGRDQSGPYGVDYPANLALRAVYPEHEHEIYRNLGLAALLGCQELDPRLEFPLYEQDYAEAESVLRGVLDCMAWLPVGAGEGMRWGGDPCGRPGPEERISLGRPGRPQGSPPHLVHHPRPYGLRGIGIDDDGRPRRSPLRHLIHPRPYGKTGLPWIGIHTGARPPVRRWPADYFAALADELVKRFDAQILLTGGPGEEAIVQAVQERMRMPALNLGGATSLGGLAALMSKLDLFICNDTGPSHIAEAIDVPSITIFGPADYTRWASLDQERHPTLRHPVMCSPCGYWECPIDHRCLRWIEPELVFMTAEKLL